VLLYGRSQELPVVPLEHPVRAASRGCGQHVARLRSRHPLSIVRFCVRTTLRQSVAFLVREHERFFVDIIYIHEKKAAGENRVQVGARAVHALLYTRPHV